MLGDHVARGRIPGGHPNVEHGVLAADRADGSQLIDAFGQRHQGWQRLERDCVERHVEAGHDDRQTSVGQSIRDCHEARPEELRLVDRDELRVVRHDCLDLVGRCRRDRRMVEPGMRCHIARRMPVIDGVSDHRDASPGDDRPPDSAQQLLGLAREHRPADHLEPTRPRHPGRMA